MVKIPAVRSNFTRNIQNILADASQDNGCLEIIRELCPNSYDHGADEIGIGIFNTSDETAILFHDNGCGMDTSPLPYNSKCDAKSSLHSFFCYGHTTNCNNGNVGRFCAGVKLIMLTADSYMILITRTKKSNKYFIYESSDPIADIIDSHDNNKEIEISETNDPLFAIKEQLKRMCKDNDTLMQKWNEILNNMKIDSPSGTSIMICSRNTLHKQGKFDMTDVWPASKNKSAQANTLITNEMERTALVTYIRSRTRHGTYINDTYSPNMVNSLSEHAENDKFLQNSLRRAQLTIFCITNITGFEVPYGFQYIRHPTLEKKGEITVLEKKFDKTSIVQTGAYFRILPQHFKDMYQNSYRLFIFSDSKRQQELKYEYFARSNHKRGGVHLNNVFGGLIFTSAGVFVQKISWNSNIIDTQKCVDLVNDPESKRSLADLFKLLEMEKMERQITCILDGDLELKQNRNTLSNDMFMLLKTESFLRSLGKAFIQIIKTSSRDAKQLQEYIKWGSHNTRASNDKDYQEFRKTIKEEVMNATHIKFKRKTDIVVPESIAHLDGHVEILPTWESGVTTTYFRWAEKFRNIESMRKDLFELITDRSSKNDNIDTTVVEMNSRERLTEALRSEMPIGPVVRLLTMEVKCTLMNYFDHAFGNTDNILVNSIAHIKDSMQIEDKHNWIGTVTSKDCKTFTRRICNICEDGTDNILTRLNTQEAHKVEVIGLLELIIHLVNPWFDYEIITPKYTKRDMRDHTSARPQKRNKN